MTNECYRLRAIPLEKIEQVVVKHRRTESDHPRQCPYHPISPPIRSQSHRVCTSFQLNSYIPISKGYLVPLRYNFLQAGLSSNTSGGSWLRQQACDTQRMDGTVMARDILPNNTFSNPLLRREPLAK